jgi:hypothetical protein
MIRPDVAALYDGSLLTGTAAWWNSFLQKRPAMVRSGAFSPYDQDRTERLVKSVNEGNRALLTAMGAAYTPVNEHLGAAAIALSYGLARTRSP